MRSSLGTKQVLILMLAVKSVFRLWSIHDREDLIVLLRSQGFPGTQQLNHIFARAQEHMIAEACRIDAMSPLCCTWVVKW